MIVSIHFFDFEMFLGTITEPFRKKYIFHLTSTQGRTWVVYYNVCDTRLQPVHQPTSQLGWSKKLYRLHLHNEALFIYMEKAPYNSHSPVHTHSHTDGCQTPEPQPSDALYVPAGLIHQACKINSNLLELLIITSKQ